MNKSTLKDVSAKEPTKKKIVINISSEVWDYLVTHADPFMTPDAVLRKLFGLPEKKRN